MSFNVVTAGNGWSEGPELLDLAATLAAGGKVTVASVVQAPVDLPLGRATAMAVRRRQQMEEMIHAHEPQRGEEITPTVLVGRCFQSELARAVSGGKSDFLLVGWNPIRAGSVPATLLTDPPADLLLASGRSFPLRRILVAIRGGPNVPLAIRVGGILAQEAGAELTVLHVSHEAGSVGTGGTAGEKAGLQPPADSPSFRFESVASAETPLKVVAAIAATYDLLIVGAPAKPWDLATFSSLFTPTRGTIVVKTKSAPRDAPTALEKVSPACMSP